MTVFFFHHLIQAVGVRCTWSAPSHVAWQPSLWRPGPQGVGAFYVGFLDVLLGVAGITLW